MPRATNYQCEICDKDYADYDEAAACEKQHVNASLVTKNFFEQGEKYPSILFIEMADGIQLQYLRNG